MAKKKGTTKKVIERIEVSQFIETDTFDYDAHYEKLGIAKVINSYFDNLAHLVNTMQYFNIPPDSTGYSIFIRKFGEISFTIDIFTLCRQIEIYLLNKPENKENLTNILSVKTKHIEGLLSTVKSIRNYEQIKSKKLNIPVNHKGMDPTKFSLLSMEPVENKPNTYYHTYGTLESFYNATLDLFNVGKSRINDLLGATLTNSGKAKDNYTNTIWFKVGLLFATGEMDKLLLKHHNNFTAIANELGNKNYRPFISETIANTNKTDKNIFSNSSKTLKIQGHCETNGLQVTDKFKSLFPSE